ncbi:GGDEF domain-containing protein [Agitococcus lubricus]|uniref:diguanylate cyclase n=1 Tax=Agitococcus lubricus TaxID=1077255 RepID=A0A2T5IUI4_9GAMM|nr:diguanylate cyclase [Agitococcus lubricus]PTQ87549.1 diguanylate cyclase (GGDEF)-like protein [Agitococcus lubricus]
MRSTESPADKQVCYSPALLTFIENCLKHRNPVFHFPFAALEERFVAKRIQDSLAFIAAGHYFLLIMFVLIIINVIAYYPDTAAANDFFIVKYVYSPLTVAISCILYGSRLRWVQAHFYHVMAPLCVFILYVITALALAHTGDYSEFVVYHLMVAIILMAFGLRFSTLYFVGILCASGLLAYLYIESHHLPFNYIKFSNYYILYSAVVVILAAITEWHERLAFLQSILLDHQTHELTRLNQQLDLMAHQDALTGIANRRYFDDIAYKEWERALRDQQPLTVLLLDVDFFKRFNDYYGHSAGDDCLKMIAQTLSHSTLRASDMVARYGGEEFILLLPNTKASGGVSVAERIIQAVDALKMVHSQSDIAPHVTVSIGITNIMPSSHLSVTDMIQQADLALYAAKERGRHQYVMYHPELLTTSTSA